MLSHDDQHLDLNGIVALSAAENSRHWPSPTRTVKVHRASKNAVGNCEDWTCAFSLFPIASLIGQQPWLAIYLDINEPG